MNPDAMAFIKSIPAPIGIVGVAGMYRTGKSYLLNRMILNRSDGFGVGPTINPCTKVFFFLCCVKIFRIYKKYDKNKG